MCVLYTSCIWLSGIKIAAWSQIGDEQHAYTPEMALVDYRSHINQFFARSSSVFTPTGVCHRMRWTLASKMDKIHYSPNNVRVIEHGSVCESHHRTVPSNHHTLRLALRVIHSGASACVSCGGTKLPTYELPARSRRRAKKCCRSK